MPMRYHGLHGYYNNNNHVARGVQKLLQDYKSLQDIIAFLGMDELSEEDKLKVARARKINEIPLPAFPGIIWSIHHPIWSNRLSAF